MSSVDDDANDDDVAQQGSSTTITAEHKTGSTKQFSTSHHQQGKSSMDSTRGRGGVNMSEYDKERLLLACSQSQEASVRAEHSLKYVAQSAYPDPFEVERVLKKYPGIDVNQIFDLDGKTPMHFAAATGSCDILSKLIEEWKGDAEISDRKQITPLHEASREGRGNAISLLVDECDCDTECRTKYAETPLHFAAFGGHLHASSVLIEHGANPKVYDILGNNPLHYAAEIGSMNLVMMFVDNKLINPSQKNKENETPLDRAKYGLKFSSSCENVVSYLAPLTNIHTWKWKDPDEDTLSIIMKKKGGRIKTTRERMFECRSDVIIYKDCDLYETKGEIPLENIRDVSRCTNGWFELLTRQGHQGKYDFCVYSKSDYNSFVHYLAKQGVISSAKKEYLTEKAPSSSSESHEENT